MRQTRFFKRGFWRHIWASTLANNTKNLAHITKNLAHISKIIIWLASEEIHFLIYKNVINTKYVCFTISIWTIQNDDVSTTKRWCFYYFCYHKVLCLPQARKKATSFPGLLLSRRLIPFFPSLNVERERSPGNKVGKKENKNQDRNLKNNRR